MNDDQNPFVEGSLKPGESREPGYPEGFAPIWGRSCQNCNSQPVVEATGLCGPCTWGEADTAGGNW